MKNAILSQGEVQAIEGGLPACEGGFMGGGAVIGGAIGLAIAGGPVTVAVAATAGIAAGLGSLFGLGVGAVICHGLRSMGRGMATNGRDA